MSILRKFVFAGVAAMALALADISGVLAADYTVVIDKMKFGPVPTELHPGDTITWQNDDIFRHSATARDASFDIDLPSKTSVKIVVGTAGNVEFFCKFHPGMKGTLVITP
jgi:plastocyanin